MKKSIIYTLILSFYLFGCFEEQEFIIPDNQKYISFKTSSLEILEGEVASVKIQILYSGPALTADLVVPVSLTGENSAQDGTDYTIESGVGNVVLASGTYNTEILVSIIDNTEAIGLRTLTFTIGSIEGYKIGAPDNEAAASIQIRILEDDLNLFGFTSFEEPVAGEINNFSSQDGTEQVNVPGENPVDFSSTGGEMGFDTYYVDGQVGGADGTFLWGVSKFPTGDGTDNPSGEEYDTGGFPDGTQAYVSSDADGLMEIQFDELEIPDGTNILQVAFQLWFADASWESDDEIDVFWRTEDGDESLLSVRGVEPQDNIEDDNGASLENMWIPYILAIETKKTGRLVLQIGSDSGSEVCFIDNIIIEGL